MRILPQITNHLKARLELFFFDPTRSQDDYDNSFRSYFPNQKTVARSPLYELRRELRECVERQKWLPAVLIADIIIGGLVFNITAKEAGSKVAEEDYRSFYKTFCGIGDAEGFFIRLLRNARQHNFGLLISRLYRKDRKSDKFKTILESNSVIVDPEVKFFKLHFPSSLDYEEVAAYSNAQVKSSHILVNIKVNPRLYTEKIESAIKPLKEYIAQNESYARNLMNNLTMDNWMRIYSNIRLK